MLVTRRIRVRAMQFICKLSGLFKRHHLVCIQQTIQPACRPLSSTRRFTSLTSLPSSPVRRHFRAPNPHANLLPDYHQSWSPNTLKTRLLLNAMQIPYTEQYVSYPDIAPLLKSYGVPANESGFAYTLPAIYHPESLKDKTPGNALLPESIAIAHHLDALYPSAPHHAFPEPKSESEALWSESEGLLRKIIFQPAGGHGYRLLMPRIPLILDDRGAEHFIRTRQASHPDKVSPLDWGSEDIEDDWRAVEPSVKAYNEYLVGKRSEAEAKGRGKGPFLLGETLSMGDIYLASILVWFQAAGQELLDRFMAIGEGDEYETSPIRDVWNAFEANGWLTGQGEERVIHERK